MSDMYRLTKILTMVAKAYGYPRALVLRAYAASEDKSIDSIIEYCEKFKENEDAKKED